MFRFLKRNFYTFNVPKDTARITLEDGSQLIARSKHITLDGIKTEEKLPPLLGKHKKFSILTAGQLQEIKNLRTTDPDSWTVTRLAKKYNIHPTLVLKIAKCPKERRERLREQELQDFNSLPISKKMTAIDRIRRKELW